MKELGKTSILIFGATGFVGSQLLKSLLKKKQNVIAITRAPKKISMKSKYLTVIKGNLLEPETYSDILLRVKHIYYLVHAMDQSDKFERIESQQARSLARNLKSKHQVIYLSGLGKPDSAHIRSRQKVGRIFAKSKAKSIEIRASIIIGDGSLSFDMIHAIAKHFPFSASSNWSRTLCEPTALVDVLYALEYFIFNKFKAGVYEMGCGESLPYDQLIMRTAKVLGKDMIELPLPLLPKSIVLEVMRFVLPEYYQAGKHLMGSIEIETKVKKNGIFELIKKEPMAIDRAIKNAIKLSTGHSNPSLSDRAEILWNNMPVFWKLLIKKLYLFYKSSR